MNWLVPAAVAVAVLMLIAFAFTWLITHPLVIVAVIASIVLLARYSARRNRV